MLAALTAALCLVQSAPALSRDQAYEAAVQERIDGKYSDAVSHLRVIIAKNPDDVDARLQLALALKAQGRDRPAERELQAVLAKTPDYKDARVALADLKLARGDVNGAKDTLGPDLMRATNDSDVAGLLGRIADAKTAKRWRMDASGSVSHLSQGLPEWKEANLSLSRKVGARSAITGSVQQLERFNLSETYVEAEVDHGWTGGEWAVAVGGSLDPLFRPETALKASVLLVPKKKSPWRLGADVNYSHYVGADVVTVRAGVDRYIAGDRGKVGVRAIDTIDDDSNNLWGYAVDGSWDFTDRWGGNASYVNAAESDAGIVVRTRAYGGALSYKLNERASVQGSIVEEMRENSYDRLEVGLGVTLRF